ncbi:MAG: ABC transporter permease [Candidatus Eiseniibacteriota bacterium]
MNGTRLLAVARKETIQLRRDPRSLAMAFALPLGLLLIFGYAISWDIEDVATAVLDEDRSARSRELREALESSGYFRIVAELQRAAEIAETLERRDAQVVLVIPPGFASALRGAGRAELQAVVDGSDANTATIVLEYVRAVVQSWATDVALQGNTRTPLVTTESRVWYNEELKSRDMIVPGLVAVIMMIVAAMLTSLTIAREWERGTMEQLAATPVTRVEVVAGKLVPYVAIGLVDVVVSTVTGVLLFDVPFRGSFALLMLLSFFFLLGALGLGVFISAVARSQLLATQMAMVATFLPAFLLSGFMFAIEVMPRALQIVTLLIPARYFLVVTRGIFLKGVGLETLAVQGALMVGFAFVGLMLATRVFRKELA